MSAQTCPTAVAVQLSTNQASLGQQLHHLITAVPPPPSPPALRFRSNNNSMQCQKPGRHRHTFNECAAYGSGAALAGRGHPDCDVPPVEIRRRCSADAGSCLSDTYHNTCTTFITAYINDNSVAQSLATGLIVALLKGSGDSAPVSVFFSFLFFTASRWPMS